MEGREWGSSFQGSRAPGRGSLPVLLRRNYAPSQRRLERTGARGRQRGLGQRGRDPGALTATRARGQSRDGEGETRPHTQSGLLAHRPRTPGMYTNINIPMYTFTRDAQIAPRLSAAPPPWAPAGSASGRGFAGGRQEAGTRGQESRGGRGPAPLSSQAPPKGPVPSPRHPGTGGETPRARPRSGPSTVSLSSDALLSLPSACPGFSVRFPQRLSGGGSPGYGVRLAPLPGPHRRLGLRCSSAEALLPLAGSLLGVGAKPQPSPGQPCWIKMSAHSWLPARRA